MLYMAFQLLRLGFRVEATYFGAQTIVHCSTGIRIGMPNFATVGRICVASELSQCMPANTTPPMPKPYISLWCSGGLSFAAELEAESS